MAAHPSTSRLFAGLYFVTTAAIFILPILVLALIMRDLHSPADVATRFPGITIAPHRGALLTAGLVGLIPLGAVLYILFHVRGLFGLYRKDAILTQPSATRIHAIGKGLFVLALVGPLTYMLQTLILTWHNPVGQRTLVLAINKDVFGFALIGVLMVIIGRAMTEAARMAEENRTFI